MATTVKDGFYLDKGTNKIFFVKKGMIPPWVRSKQSEWEPLRKEKEAELPELNSHDYEDVYKEMEINVNELGCVMLDVAFQNIPEIPNKDHLYTAKNKEKYWWIKGFVAGKTPHITLLYGLMKPAVEWKKHIQRVLSGWALEKIKIDSVSFFESNIKEEPYYCIIAHVETTPKLVEGHKRLELLPHINTFSEYKPHLTIAYVQKDKKIRDDVIAYYEGKLKGKEFVITNINYGEKKT